MNLDWLDPELREAIEAMTEAQRVALVLAGEARSEPIEGIVGVGSVMRNRVLAKTWYGATLSDVVTKKLQFSCLTPVGGPGNFRYVLALAKQFAAKETITEPRVRQCILVAHGIVDHYLLDNVQGATHYHQSKMKPRPSWVYGATLVGHRGHHAFYKDVK